MKSSEAFDYIAAIEEMQAEERKSHQIHSPDFIPATDSAVDYTAAVKAWDKAQRGRDTVNMPEGKGKRK